jgi:hypothetical protein
MLTAVECRYEISLRGSPLNGSRARGPEKTSEKIPGSNARLFFAHSTAASEQLDSSYNPTRQPICVNHGLQAAPVHRGIDLERRAIVRSCRRRHSIRVHRDSIRELQQVRQSTRLPETGRLVQQRSCICYVWWSSRRKQARCSCKSLRRCTRR